MSYVVEYAPSGRHAKCQTCKESIGEVGGWWQQRVRAHSEHAVALQANLCAAIPSPQGEVRLGTETTVSDRTSTRWRHW